MLISFFSLLSGCANPPAEELEYAKQAIAEAKLKEANLYAEDFFKKAEGSLQRAYELADQKEYKEAKAAAVEAARFAKHAGSMVESNKERMLEESHQMLKNIKTSIDEFKILAARALKKSPHVNREDIQRFIDMWESEIISLGDNLDEKGIRHEFDRLIIIKKQIKHQKNNLNSLLNQKET